MSLEAQLSSDDLFDQVLELCQSKADEFLFLGYENITALDVWRCVSSSYKELPPMHRLVNDVLSLKITKYMNWLMLNMYKNPGAI
ncbi:post-transcriptional regulator [Brevibacillus dissolubilis]|uniref:post-transcriptional regulator n=1 Tax=Brevibacillus dissolubilis TaxID=1844116 RepID=UPI001116BC33|nr:post-transcriptional regulator [Brevibacillus dissolubilis]